MLPSETMIWQPEFTDKTLSRKPGAVQYVFLCKVEAWAMNIGCHLTIPQSCEFQLLRDKQEA
ncbi:hypothetical protein CEP72_24445 [Escherichia coli O157]|nr:hypothetical protein CEP72_24445 [Escherichia coli O157]